MKSTQEMWTSASTRSGDCLGDLCRSSSFNATIAIVQALTSHHIFTAICLQARLKVPHTPRVRYWPAHLCLNGGLLWSIPVVVVEGQGANTAVVWNDSRLALSHRQALLIMRATKPSRSPLAKCCGTVLSVVVSGSTEPASRFVQSQEILWERMYLNRRQKCLVGTRAGAERGGDGERTVLPISYGTRRSNTFRQSPASPRNGKRRPQCVRAIGRGQRKLHSQSNSRITVQVERGADNWRSPFACDNCLICAESLMNFMG